MGVLVKSYVLSKTGMKSNLWDTVCRGVLCKSYVSSKKSKLVSSKQSK